MNTLGDFRANQQFPREYTLLDNNSDRNVHSLQFVNISGIGAQKENIKKTAIRYYQGTTNYKYDFRRSPCLYRRHGRQ